MWLLTLSFDSTSLKWSGGGGEVKTQSRCQTRSWFNHLQKQPPASQWCRGPRHLRFPLDLNIQASLATSYWFSIPLNIALLLIEFTHRYQCLKDSCPPLPAPPRCSLFSWRRISHLPCRSSTSDSSLRRANMEIDHRGENGICVSSTLDKHREQQRWVRSCSTFLPFSSGLLKALTSYLWSCPPPVCRHYITVGLSVQVKECKVSLQAPKYVIPTIKSNCRDSWGTSYWI